MVASKKLLAAASCALLAACGGRPAETQPDGGSGSYALTLIGNANLSLHPGDKRTLQVVLAQDQVGPVANAGIHFEFQDGNAAGAQLEASDVKTDANGIAAVHFTAGNTSLGRPTFKLVASSTDYNAAPVAFSFSIIPVTRLLQIVGAPGTKVSPDGQSATVSMYVSSSYGLRVRELDQDTGAPIAGDTLNFSLPPVQSSSSSWSGGTSRTTTVITGESGEAQVFLLSTAKAEAFLVVGQSAAGGAAVNFSVTVQPYATSSCTSSAQCGPGQTCVGGHCQNGGGGAGCGSGTDNPCPFGYQCIGGVCQPPATTTCDATLQTGCGSGQCCDGSGTCRDNCATPCGPGQTCVVPAGGACGSGVCQSAPTVPDVTGVWTTKHIFSIRDALPGAVQGIFTALRVLDQALLGKLTIPGLPAWLNAIINKALSKLLQQYIPDWVKTVIRIGDDIGTILSNLRSEGSMRINPGADATHVKGSEVWTSLVFYWLPLCNGNIQGDPEVPPECARIDIATTDSSNPADVGQCKGQSLPSITVQAAPFTGAVTGTAAPYSLSIARRQVSLKMGKVILVVVDYLISLTTPYHCIDEATDCHKGSPCLVDCPQLGQDISNLTRGFISPDDGEQICDTVVSTAGQAITGLLANAWPVNADVLDFSGRATVHESGKDGTPVITDCSSGVRCADVLGNDNFDRDLRKNTAARDGNWEGDFFFKLIHKLPGAWEAKRPQQ